MRQFAERKTARSAYAEQKAAMAGAETPEVTTAPAPTRFETHRAFIESGERATIAFPVQKSPAKKPAKKSKRKAAKK